MASPVLPDWFPHSPFERQREFLDDPAREAVFAGRPGAGKSEAVLMGAFQGIDNPKHSAVIVCEDYEVMSLPGAILDRCKGIVAQYCPEAGFSPATLTFRFPSGASIQFVPMSVFDYVDINRLRGVSANYIGIDEADSFLSESHYRFLLSRLRGDGSVPLRVRLAVSDGNRWMVDYFTSHPERAVFKAESSPYVGAMDIVSERRSFW